MKKHNCCTARPFPKLSFGVAGMAGLCKRTPSPDQVRECIRSAPIHGATYIDTSPTYGCGHGDIAIGRARTELTDLGQLPNMIYSIKCGERLTPCHSGKPAYERGWWDDPRPFDAVRDPSDCSVRRTVHASLMMTGLEVADILYLHDIERWINRTPPDGCCPGTEGDRRRLVVNQTIPEMLRLRADGDVRALGIACKDIPTIEWLLGIHDSFSSHEPPLFEYALVPNAVNLLGAELITSGCLDKLAKRGIRVINASPFRSGVLAGRGTFDYDNVPLDIQRRVRAMAEICREFHAPLPAVALQYAAADSRISSVMVGPTTAEELAQCAEWLKLELDPRIWPALNQATFDNDQPLLPRPFTSFDTSLVSET